MIGSLLPCGTGRPSQSGQSGQPRPDSVTRTTPPTATSAHAARAAARAASRKPTPSAGTGMATIEQGHERPPLIKIDQETRPPASLHCRQGRDERRAHVSTASPFDEQAPSERAEPAAEPQRTGFVESI